MEHGESEQPPGQKASPPRTPPPPPEPRAVDANNPPVACPSSNDAQASDEPLKLTSENWSLTSISPLAALRMLSSALENLAEATGDIPPTPPVSRPTTPKIEPTDPLDRKPSLHIGSPEAHPHEPISLLQTTSDSTAQQAAIARRFFSKVAPPFTLSDWLKRLHTYCPHSTGVYLAAAAYIHRLCVAELTVPATSRTVHRLALAAIRVAAKGLEDHKWSQERMARMGGVSKAWLMKIEVTLCYLLDFNLWIDEGVLRRRMFLLQQAASQSVSAKGRLRESFQLKLPLRRQLAMAQAATATAAAG